MAETGVAESATRDWTGYLARRCRPIAGAALAALLVGSTGLWAEAQEHGEEPAAEHEAAGHEEHEFHRHHFSVFLGVTDGEIEKEAIGAESEEPTVSIEDERAFTSGLDYEYRLNRRWGIGALIDYAGKDTRSWVAGIPLFLHPGAGWKLLVAPGLEDKKNEDPEFLVRIGVLYDFEVGRFSIAPAFQVDFVDNEEILVYGFNIGKGF